MPCCCVDNGSRKAAAVTGGCVASYLLLYTAYDKSTKALNPSLLGRVLSFKDVDFSLRQLNKVTGLSCLTLAGIALVPSRLSEGCESALLKMAMAIGWFHSAKSAYLYYGGDFRKMVAGAGKRVRFEFPALVLGYAGMFLLMADAFPIKNGRPSICGKAALAPGAFLGLLLASLHFYFIETPTGLPQDLPCRPYAYTAWASAAFALNTFGFSNLANYVTKSVGITA